LHEFEKFCKALAANHPQGVLDRQHKAKLNPVKNTDEEA